MAAYPRKQTVFIFIICALITGATAFYVYGQSGTPSPSQVTSSEAMNVSSESQATGTTTISTDWQKDFLAATASNTAFSTATKNTAAAAASDENLTATDKLGRDFLVKYAQLKQSGLSSDSQTVTNMMGQLTAQNIASLPEPKTYSIKDIHIGTDTTAALRQYGETITSIFVQNVPTQNEAVIADKAFQDNDMSELAQIDAVAAGYRSALSRLLAMPVPTSLSTYHISLINGLSMSLYNANSIRHIDVDPVRGLGAVALELAGLQTVDQAVTNIKNTFISAGVPLSL